MFKHPLNFGLAVVTGTLVTTELPTWVQVSAALIHFYILFYYLVLVQRPQWADPTTAAWKISFLIFVRAMSYLVIAALLIGVPYVMAQGTIPFALNVAIFGPLSFAAQFLFLRAIYGGVKATFTRTWLRRALSDDRGALLAATALSTVDYGLSLLVEKPETWSDYAPALAEKTLLLNIVATVVTVVVFRFVIRWTNRIVR